MTLGNIRAIGPVVVDYRNPSLRWTGNPTNGGVQPCTIGGSLTLAQAHSLRELINNPDAPPITRHGFTGVQEFIECDGDAVGPLEGEYLLQGFDFEIDHSYVFGGRALFTMTAAYLGDLVDPAEETGTTIDGGTA